MLASVSGHYRQGVIELDEVPPHLTEARVIVTFLPETPTGERKRPLGLAPDRGQPLPVDFDAPLPEDLMGAFRGEGA